MSLIQLFILTIVVRTFIKPALSIFKKVDSEEIDSIAAMLIVLGLAIPLFLVDLAMWGLMIYSGIRLILIF